MPDLFGEWDKDDDRDFIRGYDEAVALCASNAAGGSNAEKRREELAEGPYRSGWSDGIWDWTLWVLARWLTRNGASRDWR